LLQPCFAIRIARTDFRIPKLQPELVDQRLGTIAQRDRANAACPAGDQHCPQRTTADGIADAVAVPGDSRRRARHR